MLFIDYRERSLYEECEKLLPEYSQVKLESTNLFGAAAIFGKGFFPSTIWGWLILIFLVFLLVVLARTFFGKKKA
jgi:hypothetical protein